MSVYNAAGTVDVLGDIAGYYQPAGASGGAVGAAGPVGAVGPAGPAGSPNRNWASTRQIAMLQWGRGRVQPRAAPWGVPYDGTSVGRPAAVRHLDDRVRFQTGADPWGVTYDGTSVWTANFIDDTVSKIDPISGARTDFPAAAGPRGITIIGTSNFMISEG